MEKVLLKSNWDILLTNGVVGHLQKQATTLQNITDSFNKIFFTTIWTTLYIDG